MGYLIISPIQKYLPTREDIDTKSLKEGQKVSSLRRITLFLGDIFIYLLMIMLVSILINNKYINLSLAVLYFIIIHCPACCYICTHCTLPSCTLPSCV